MPEINTSVDLSSTEIIRALTSSNNEKQLINFVLELDQVVGDWHFTETLHARLSEELLNR